MVRPVLVVLAVLCASSASAQPPPWAGRPVEPTPSFLIVPPRPETVEPDEVRVMRDDAGRSEARLHELRAELAEHDCFLAVARAAGDAALDPDAESLRRRTTETLAHADAELAARRFDVASAAYIAALASVLGVPDLRQRVIRRIAAVLAEPRRRHEPSYQPLRRALAVISGIEDERVSMEIMLALAGTLTDRDDDDAAEAAAEVRRELDHRYDCTWLSASELPLDACDAEARSRDRFVPACGREIWSGTPGHYLSDSCDVIPAVGTTCHSWLRIALHAHQQAHLHRSHSVEDRDPEGEAETLLLYAEAARSYGVWLEGCGGEDTYVVTYNLADALFWSEQFAEAAVRYAEVRDWSWQDGRGRGAYAREAARRVAESRHRVFDVAVVLRGELVLPDPSPTPRPAPELVSDLIVAREIYLARFTDEVGEEQRVSFLLANAVLLERYGYWDEARTRYAAVLDAAARTDDDARLAAAGIVRMAMALGDAAEVARIAALAPASP